MNCLTCQNELEDFLYGELEAAQSNAVRAHLRGCAACAQVQAALESEQEIFAQYYDQAAAEPSSEMWRAIQGRLQEAPPVQKPVEPTAATSGWWPSWLGETLWLRQAAFAAALVIFSVTATALYFKWQTAPSKESTVAMGPTATPASVPSPTVSPSLSPSPAGSVAPGANTEHAAPKALPATAPKKLTEDQVIQNQMARAEHEYQQAIKLLDRVIARKRDTFDPGLWQQYTASLALIDQSIAESRRALHSDANEAVSGQFLLAAYAKKLDLMRDIAMQAWQ